MRDPIVAIALAGTSRQEQARFSTGTPVDALLAQLPEGETERTFLLSAGAWAMYRQAGTQAQQLDEKCQAAPAETLRECSPEAALLLAHLFTHEQAELLPEALERMRQLKLRLPFRMLPQALNMTGKETRAALSPLLGERGRWLSQFNPSWKWVNNHLATPEESLPADAETIWQEGTSGQRIEILRLLRAVDAGKGREWLEGVWKQERAEARENLIGALEISLSADDEPFLEKALDDRAGGVRAAAAALLSRLPASAFCERMRQRGLPMVQMIDGSINIKVPSKFVPEWQRDGIIENPPKNISKRAWWLVQLFAIIDPTCWESHLGASPAELLALLPADHEWQTQIIEGWSKAAMSFRSQNWLVPLFSWWCEHYNETIDKKSLTEYGYRESLLNCISGPVAEQLLLKLIEKDSAWLSLVGELPKPWSVEFARTYLRLFRERCTVEQMRADSFNPYSDPWLSHLSQVALALPVACLAEASWSWDFPEDSRWQIHYARQHITEFTTIVHTRQRIHEEIC